MEDATSRHSPRLYYALAALLVAAMAVALFLRPLYLGQLDSDAWEHIASVSELMYSLQSPSHPQVAVDAPSRQFHPYFVALAAMAQTFGISSFSAFAFGGCASFALLLSGIGRLASSHFGNRSNAGLIVVLCLMGLWGIPWIYAGMHSPRSLLHGAGYPATFVLGLSFWWVATTIRSVPQTHVYARVAGGLVVSLLVAVGFVTHPFQALVGIVMGGCIVAGHGALTLVAYAISCAVGIFCAYWWPHFNVFDLIFASTSGAGFSGHSDYRNPAKVLMLVGPALLGLFVAPKVWRTPADRGIVVCFAVFVIAFLVGSAAHHPIAHRLLAPAILGSQLLIAAALLRCDAGTRQSRIGRAVVVGSFCVQIAFALAEYVRFAHFQYSGKWIGSFPYITEAVDDYSRIAKSLSPNAVVVAAPNVALPAGAFGIKLLSHPRVASFIPDAPARAEMNQDVLKGVAVKTIALRPTHILVATPDAARINPALANATARTPTVTLFTIRDP